MIVEMDDVFKQNTAVGMVEHELQARVVILPPNGTQPIILADAAAEIWQQLDTINSVEDISQEFSDSYGIGIDEIRLQVRSFIQQLAELEVAVRA